MHPEIFIKGFSIGLAIAAPVGPIGVLCIGRTLSLGRGAGLFTGLGAASADAVYGCIGGFGLTAVSELLISQGALLRIVGALFLSVLGLRAIFRKAEAAPPAPGRGGLAGAYASAFALTLANPLTILSFAAVFAALGLAATAGSYLAAATLVAGVFCGSAAWWFLLSFAVAPLGSRLTPRRLAWINRASGAFLVCAGLAALAGLV